MRVVPTARSASTYRRLIASSATWRRTGCLPACVVSVGSTFFAPPSQRDVLRWRLERILPPGRSRIAIAILGDGSDPPCYPEVARRPGVHVGTIHRHLGRLRRYHP